MALDIIVVMLYTAGMLGLGWYGMRRAKTHEDYLVAGRNLGPMLYMGTMATTVLVAPPPWVPYAWGTFTAFPASGCAPRWAWASSPQLFWPPLLRLRIFTVTQVLEQRYNPTARQASAVIMLAYALMIGVTSTLAMATVLQVLLDLPFWASLLLGGVWWWCTRPLAACGR